VSITVATPGWIESEITLGKFVSREGELVVDQDTRDVQVGPSPVGYMEDYVDAMVEGNAESLRLHSQRRDLYVKGHRRTSTTYGRLAGGRRLEDIDHIWSTSYLNDECTVDNEDDVCLTRVESNVLTEMALRGIPDINNVFMKSGKITNEASWWGLQ